MSLVFQPRADGFRVVRMEGNIDVMLASVRTRFAEPHRLEDKRFDPHNGREIPVETRYTLLPRAEWTIHSAGGPITFADVEEILANVPAE